MNTGLRMPESKNMVVSWVSKVVNKWELKIFYVKSYLLLLLQLQKKSEDCKHMLYKALKYNNV